MQTDLELFARKLKLIRQKRKFTLEKLEEVSNLTPNHIAKLEAGKSNPSFNSISELAHALNVELKELFNFDELKDENYIREEFKKLINYSDEKHLQLLYKVHRDLIEF